MALQLATALDLCDALHWVLFAACVFSRCFYSVNYAYRDLQPPEFFQSTL